MRRVENAANGLGSGGPSGHSRHASSTRAEQQQLTGHHSINGLDQQQQARTLSPDRKDRYRASGRGYGYDATSGGGLPYHHPGGQPAMGGAGGGSNSNSYNQYNSQPPFGGGYGSEMRPTPPSSLPPLSLPQHSPVKVAPPVLTTDNSGGGGGGSPLQVSSPQVENTFDKPFIPSLLPPCLIIVDSRSWPIPPIELEI